VQCRAVLGRCDNTGRLATEDEGATVIDETLLKAEEKMDKAVEVAKEEFATIRTGRASPSMFVKILVDYYGAPTPLQQLASFSTPEARVIVITPYDRGAMSGIERALRESDLGVNPTNDGSIIRVVLPYLTEERRKEYIKLAKHKAEDARVAVRNIRRKAKEELDRIVRDGEAGEDAGARAEKELEQVTKRHVERIDDVLRHKENELLEV
jgi:ribosome recycling factor